MNKALLNEIYELIKEEYGDCVSVKIFVNCEGIKCETDERPFTIGCSMRTINGKWLENKDDTNGLAQHKEPDSNGIFF